MTATLVPPTSADWAALDRPPRCRRRRPPHRVERRPASVPPKGKSAVVADERTSALGATLVIFRTSWC